MTNSLLKVIHEWILFPVPPAMSFRRLVCDQCHYSATLCLLSAEEMLRHQNAQGLDSNGRRTSDATLTELHQGAEEVEQTNQSSANRGESSA